MKKFIIILLFWAAPVIAQLQPLPVEQAFAVSATTSPTELQLQWNIAPDYQLYRERVSLKPIGHWLLPSYNLPTGLISNEVGSQEHVYRNSLTINIPMNKIAPGEYQLQVNYQGCSLHGFCYPPQTRVLIFQTSQFGTQVVEWADSATVSAAAPASPPAAGQSIGLILLSFFGVGILLAFTPCVLPMIPILSGIILGGKRSRREAFYLSLTYVLAMAAAYAAAGMLAALAGSYWQSALQQPWIIVLFALLFIGLALSLFGVYELRLPSALQQKINTLSQKQKSGSYWGVAIMGVLSVLIVSPCISAPLVAALAYISQSGHQAIGGLMLFLMGLGMGLPLLIIATLGHRFLPKAGAWMDSIKVIIGLLLLATAISLLGRIVAGFIVLWLYSGLLLFAALYGLVAFKKIQHLLRRIIGIVLIILLLTYSAMLAIGAVQKHEDPWHPLRQNQTVLTFKTIYNSTDFQAALAQAQGKPIMLDVYADWCVSCKSIERNIFANAAAQSALKNYFLLRLDVTANDAGNRALEKSLDVYAPPTIIFFNAQHQESSRLFGEFSITEFLNVAQK